MEFCGRVLTFAVGLGHGLVFSDSKFPSLSLSP